MVEPAIAKQLFPQSGSLCISRASHGLRLGGLLPALLFEALCHCPACLTESPVGKLAEPGEFLGSLLELLAGFCQCLGALPSLFCVRIPAGCLLLALLGQVCVGLLDGRDRSLQRRDLSCSLSLSSLVAAFGIPGSRSATSLLFVETFSELVQGLVQTALGLDEVLLAELTLFECVGEFGQFLGTRLQHVLRCETVQVGRIFPQQSQDLPLVSLSLTVIRRFVLEFPIQILGRGLQPADLIESLLQAVLQCL